MLFNGYRDLNSLKHENSTETSQFENSKIKNHIPLLPYIEVARALNRNFKYDKAIQILKYLKKDGYDHNPTSLTVLLESLAYSNRINDAMNELISWNNLKIEKISTTLTEEEKIKEERRLKRTVEIIKFRMMCHANKWEDAMGIFSNLVEVDQTSPKNINMLVQCLPEANWKESLALSGKLLTSQLQLYEGYYVPGTKRIIAGNHYRLMNYFATNSTFMLFNRLSAHVPISHRKKVFTMIATQFPKELWHHTTLNVYINLLRTLGRTSSCIAIFQSAEKRELMLYNSYKQDQKNRLCLLINSFTRLDIIKDILKRGHTKLAYIQFNKVINRLELADNLLQGKNKSIIPIKKNDSIDKNSLFEKELFNQEHHSIINEPRISLEESAVRKEKYWRDIGMKAANEIFPLLQNANQELDNSDNIKYLK